MGGCWRGRSDNPSDGFYHVPNAGDHPSPPFPEFTSGHSAFSASAAKMLHLITCSDLFVLGDGTIGLGGTLQPGDSRFEADVTSEEQVSLFWNTFSEAADEAGASRLYGGIHFEEGDLLGRELGDAVGEAVYHRTQFFLNGAVAVPEPGGGLLILLSVLAGGFARRKKNGLGA